MFPKLYADQQAIVDAFPSTFPKQLAQKNVNLPSINADHCANKGNMIADNIMEFGYSEAAKIARKQKICFTLFYFLAFGRAPRSF